MRSYFDFRVTVTDPVNARWQEFTGTVLKPEPGTSSPAHAVSLFDGVMTVALSFVTPKRPNTIPGVW